LEFERSVLRWT